MVSYAIILMACGRLGFRRGAKHAQRPGEFKSGDGPLIGKINCKLRCGELKTLIEERVVVHIHQCTVQN